MWSYVGRKSQERWLWHAIDHKTGKVLAYTDSLGTYKRCLTPENHVVSKYNMQRIENKCDVKASK